MVTRIENGVYGVLCKNGKMAQYDTNTWICKGSSGKVLKEFPNKTTFSPYSEQEEYFLDMLEECIAVHRCGFCEDAHILKYVSIAERILNLNLTWNICFTRCTSVTEELLDDILRQWKPFVKYLRNVENARCRSLKNVFSSFQKERIFNELTKHVSAEDARWFSNQIRPISEDFIPTQREITFAKSVYFDFSESAIGQFLHMNLPAQIRNTIDKSRTMNITIPTGTDVFSIMVNIHTQYTQRELAKEEARLRIVNAEVQKMQNSIPLFYENDTFITVIPQTYRDFAEEGDKLHNCLGAHEWNYYTSKHLRRIVYVRRKSNPTKSYIALDINTRDNAIIQYLTYNNNAPTEAEAIAFKREYQNYLNTLPCLAWEEVKDR